MDGRMDDVDRHRHFQQTPTSDDDREDQSPTSPLSFDGRTIPSSASNSEVDSPLDSEASASLSSMGTRSTKSTGTVSTPNKGARFTSKRGFAEGREPTGLTPEQRLLRAVSLYIVPATLALPVSLLLHLITCILEPLYNTLPLTLHITELYIALTIPPILTYLYITRKASAREIVSARVCVSLIAFSGDVAAVFARKIGSAFGNLGPEWGPLGARFVLGAGAVGGATGFALLCYEHILSTRPPPIESVFNLANITVRAAFFVTHIFWGHRLWQWLLGDSTSFIVQQPEKTILCLSLLLTGLSLFVQPSRHDQSITSSLHSRLTSHFKLSTDRNLEKLTPFLPRSLTPIFLLLRIPLLILALRQQIFLRPNPPFLLPDGSLRILSSGKSLTGQIVVAENLMRGYRFLRCDASILGGRWIRQEADEHGGMQTQLGDSIFAAFVLQEIGVLAMRNDPSESLMRTISMTTELEVIPEAVEDPDEERLQERVLFIGLGIGVAATAMSRRGFALDVVELDPVVYEAARTHFNLTLPPDSTSVNLIDAASYISLVSEYNVEMNGTMQKWSYVIHDCFTGGGVPGEVFTIEFWQELVGLVEEDGIVAVNVAGLPSSKAVKAILVTLHAVFNQCRAFKEPVREKNELVNMIVLCTMAYAPLLTFRQPTRQDFLRSALRAQMFSNFQQNELQFDSILSSNDWEDPELVLHHGADLEKIRMWQKATSFATWRAMQQLMTKNMWMAW